jgi:hypothetical protein
MSRGPGALQKAIMDELRKAPGVGLPWTELKSRFPKEVAQHSLHRAVRSLLDRGLVFDHYAGNRRYVALTILGDTDLRTLCDAAHQLLALVAKARGVPMPPLASPELSSPVPPKGSRKRPSRHAGDA